MSMGRIHPSHPQHELEPKNHSGSPYTCSGCRMQGFGKRHGCEYCDYVLHEDCMFPATHPIRHPFFGNSTFKFLYQPEPTGGERYCDACGKPIYGFNYHCRKKEGDWDLHPCCSKLKDQLLIDGVKFRLCDKVSSGCHWCNRRHIQHGVSGVRGWSYVSRCSKYRFHVHCVSEMMQEGWRRAGGMAGRDDGDALAIERIELSTLSAGGRNGSGRYKENKYWRMVKIFLRTVVGILFGDPSAVVAAFMADLIAN
ncbi:hypothetical protein SAY86_007902 [Trapa natans]|uniref:DC1 domain-containing protein n=1 Tax=Trapa natans TaxID=22666 RepID=A0AAN7R2L5_TRANT|nr:hypothetical protein SAY86_007902 [Trapa natans]